ncbi:hypothetical protein L3X38_041470 [Prunus dulcis]|uniref:Uncharacterized protein n=1 Tax=Prunus dulcis TaxID=3755 RepID=A0AAD4UUQ8_PRUDU|nr:hypothetical protein L3X38_041470 [Prunus dulcis]
MDCFAEESTFLVNDNGKNEELNNLEHLGNATPHFNTSNIYKDLGDLENLGRVGEVGYNFCSEPDSRSHFLELYDLDQPQHPDLDQVYFALMVTNSGFYFDFNYIIQSCIPLCFLACITFAAFGLFNELFTIDQRKILDV